jgi:hypothetical protein
MFENHVSNMYLVNFKKDCGKKEETASFQSIGPNEMETIPEGVGRCVQQWYEEKQNE